MSDDRESHGLDEGEYLIRCITVNPGEGVILCPSAFRYIRTVLENGGGMMMKNKPGIATLRRRGNDYDLC